MELAALSNIESRMRQRIVTTCLVMMTLCPPLCPVASAEQCRPDENLSAIASEADTPKTSEEIEYDVKAAFIYNIMKFIEWPAEKEIAPDPKQGRPSPMIIGILGENPFRQSFRPLLDKTIQGRAIQLVEIQGYPAFLKKTKDKQNAPTAYRNQYRPIIQPCKVLFICPSEKTVLDEILSMAHGNPTLTISDIPGFSKKGGMIEFVTENREVRFEINPDAATQEGLRIRSQLLGLARKIHFGKRLRIMNEVFAK